MCYFVIHPIFLHQTCHKITHKPRNKNNTIFNVSKKKKENFNKIGHICIQFSVQWKTPPSQIISNHSLDDRTLMIASRTKSLMGPINRDLLHQRPAPPLNSPLQPYPTAKTEQRSLCEYQFPLTGGIGGGSIIAGAGVGFAVKLRQKCHKRCGSPFRWLGWADVYIFTLGCKPNVLARCFKRLYFKFVILA